MELKATEAARAFVLQWTQSNGSEAQAELERMLQALIELDALLLALDGVPGEAAEEHRRACATERATLATQIAARLRIWRDLGGGFVFTPPSLEPHTARALDGALLPVSVATGEPAAGDSAGPDADVEPVEGTEPEAAPLPDALLVKLQRHFSDGLTGTGDDETHAYIDQSSSFETVARLQAALAGLTLPPEAPEPDWDSELARLQHSTADIHTAWGTLPSDLQRDLLALAAAHARHVQAHHPNAAEDPTRKAIAAIFSRLSHFSRTYWPGAVHGLNHQHTPRNGTWLADARVYLARLHAIAGLEDGMARPKRQPERTASSAKNGAVRIVDFLQDEGFLDAEAQTVARAVMEEAKLTRPGKEGMEASKQDRARALFQQHKLRVCDNQLCGWLRARDTSEGTPIAVAARYCDVCGGSDNRREALAMAACMSERGLHRLLVVGGSDDTRTDLSSNVPDGIELKLVDGVGYHTQKDARANMQWAEVMAVWGATELDHKVSNLYRRPPAEVVSVNLVQRGVAALCREVRLRLYPDTLPGG